MHEQSLISELIHRASTVVKESGAHRASRVAVRLGVLAHLSPGHLESHFRAASAGSVLDGAVLDIEFVEDPGDPHAADLTVTSVDVAWDV